jgi:hypothetical protein
MTYLIAEPSPHRRQRCRGRISADKRAQALLARQRHFSERDAL